MNVQHGNSTLSTGPGVTICLSGEEVATAIEAYLVAHNIVADGFRTVSINGNFCGPDRGTCTIHVAPAGFVITNGVKFTGSGKIIKSDGTEL